MFWRRWGTNAPGLSTLSFLFTQVCYKKIKKINYRYLTHNSCEGFILSLHPYSGLLNTYRHYRRYYLPVPVVLIWTSFNMRHSITKLSTREIGRDETTRTNALLKKVDCTLAHDGPLDEDEQKHILHYFEKIQLRNTRTWRVSNWQHAWCNPIMYRHHHAYKYGIRSDRDLALDFNLLLLTTDMMLERSGSDDTYSCTC